jgi:hypothetical protein
MSRAVPARSEVTFVDLEFDTATRGVALGDIASSLVSLDELLRDLASIAAHPSEIEFRKIEIVAIQMRSPLTIRLALFAISPDALKAFQEICRDVILFRERRSPADITVLLESHLPRGEDARVTEQEARRVHGHVAALQNAAIPLKRVEVIEE